MDHIASSSSIDQWKHDVFLSYRVEDTHKNFTDHLYVALVRAGIRTFRYDRQLPMGLNLCSVLGKAIRESRVSIVVFSTDYATSERCLDELVKIVDCKEDRRQLIIPVFYNVDSNDVRKQSGAFADAFAKHEERYVDEIAKVERWRLALREATKLSGWELQKFANGHEAKFIQENDNVHLHGNYDGLFEELRWLCWHHCPLDSLPVEFHPGKLVFLDMQHNNFNKLWQGTKFLGNLKILNMGESESLTTTPDFSGVPNLEKLSLMSCPKLSNVDSTIGLLDKLTSLNLRQCNNLKYLPSSICNLRSLETLNLGFLSKLEQLPEKLGDMEQLRDINVDATAIKELPDSIGFLCNLNSLNLSECKNLRGLPSSICNVKSLEYLYMNGCSSLHSLPEDVGNIKCLRMLIASGTSIETLPESIGLLSELTGLHLEECKNLLSLPENICNLISLEVLNLGSCSRVELGESAQMWDKCLLNLARLNLRYCNLSDRDIPHNLGAFMFLDDLCLEGNNFCSLPSSLGQLSNLLTLNLGGCRNLQSVEVFPPNLTGLILKGCSSLENLQLSKLKYLGSVDLKNCSSLVEIQGLDDLSVIKEIIMEGCWSLPTAFTDSLIQGQFGLARGCAIYFSRMEIPNWFEYQTTGDSSISFDVPLHVEPASLDVTIWADYSFGKIDDLARRFVMHITNITNGDDLTHSLWGRSFGAGSWVRHISPDYSIKSGDRIKVYLEMKDKNSGTKVEKYGVHLAKTKHNNDDLILTKRGLNTNTVETKLDSKRQMQLLEDG